MYKQKSEENLEINKGKQSSAIRRTDDLKMPVCRKLRHGSKLRRVKLRRGKSTGRDSKRFAQEKMSNSFNKYDNKHTCTQSS